MKWGDIPANNQLFAEATLVVNPNSNIATNGNLTITVGTYSMPFAGSAVTHLRVQNSWTTANIQQVTCIADPSTPAPSVKYGSVEVENGLNGGSMFQTNHVFGSWVTLASGTVITVKVNVAVGVFAPTVNVGQISGVIRAYRS